MTVKKDATLMTLAQAMAMYEKPDLQLIKDTVAKGATDAELGLFIWTAQMRGLNPLTRQIHLVKRKQGDKEVAVIQTGIDGFRLIADRTGRYVPSSKPTLFEHEKGADGRPYLVRATVYGMKIVSGQAFEFSATAKFREYAQSFGGRLGNMWQKMPETMLEKCAEAKLLRKGFPEELSGLYSDDEMEQADNTGAQIPIHHAETGQEPAIPTSEQKPATEEEPEAVEGEFRELSTEDEDPLEGNPYAKLLEKCTEHDVEWGINPYGKHFHKQDNSFCNFGTHQPLKDTLKAVALVIGFYDERASDLNAYCKSKFGAGQTWSKISDKDKLNVIWDFAKMAGDPVLLEAAKLAISKKEEVQL
jgi:phage recombination protein Bet